MNKKITRILGVVLSLTMVLGSLAISTPAYAAPGEQQWFRESTPSGSTAVPYSSFFLWPGSSVADFAVADATTIYIAVSHAVATERGIFKSTNAGQSWAPVTNYPTQAAQNPRAISVAPDNVNSIAMIDAANGVHVSNDGGTTWSTLPAFVAPAAASTATDIAVGPARSGTLLSREYVVALADPAAGVAGGDCQIIGNIATWATVGSVATPIAATYDCTSVVVSPNFVGDRCVAIVATGIVAPFNRLLIVNTATNQIIQGTALNAGAVGPTADLGAVANGILTSDISLPTNWDPTTAAGRRTYVCFTSASATDTGDAFRVDNDTSRALGAVAATVGLRTIAFAGTVDAGKLYVGQNIASVKWTDSPTSSLPTWTTATKNPAGVAAAANTVVRTATDFSTTNRVFAGTSGAAGQNNEFAISNDGGVSFNGEAFINCAAKNLTLGLSIAIAPDGKTIYMATTDNAFLNIWKSATPVTGTSWSRVFTVAVTLAGDGVLLAVNSDYATTPTVFVVVTNAAAVAAEPIYVSQNAGATFNNRVAPAAIPRAIGVQDANTLYLGVGANVYKSTNAGWTWNTPVAGKQTGNITSIIVPRFDDVVIGGTGGASYSVDGGANFTAINTGLTGAIFVTADAKYSGNKTVYAAQANGAALRYIIGTSGQWEPLANPAAAAAVAAEQRAGTLYVLQATQADRALNPADPVGNINWSTINAAPANPPANMGTPTAVPPVPQPTNCLATAADSAAVTVYGLGWDTQPRLWSYRDLLAVSKPDLTGPADKSTLGVDPVSGRGDFINVTMKKMGVTTGLVTNIDIEIRQKATGLTGTPTWLAVAVPTENPAALVTGPTALTPFLSNMEYVWAIRAQNTISGDLVMSNWTTARTFTVQSGGIVAQEQVGPIITSPQGGAQNLEPKLVGITWAPVYGATEYTVIVATDAAMTKTIAGTPAKVTATSFQVANLEYSTTYFYSVQATKPTVGPAKTGSFSTMAKPVPPVTTTPAPPVTPQIIFPEQKTPAYVWAIIAIGAVLIIAMIVLIVRTRRVP